MSNIGEKYERLKRNLADILATEVAEPECNGTVTLDGDLITVSDGVASITLNEQAAKELRMRIDVVLAEMRILRFNQ